MKFRIQVLRVADDGAERMKEVMEFERQELAMETLGMSLAEGKAVLKGVQEFVAEQQAAEFLQRERTCRHCARHLSSKGAGSTSVRTVFGTVRLPNPRWNQCDCQSTGKGTFRPLQGWLCEQPTSVSASGQRALAGLVSHHHADRRFFPFWRVDHFVESLACGKPRKPA